MFSPQLAVDGVKIKLPAQSFDETIFFKMAKSNRGSSGVSKAVEGAADTEKLYNVRGNMVTEKEFNRLRQQAVRKAWNQEEELVRKTGRGTYDWNEDEIKDLLTPYKEKGYRGVKGYEGQHMKSAKEYPDFVEYPDNIQFLKGRNMEIKEHFEAHSRNYQNPTNGYYDPKTQVMVDFGDEVPWKK